MVLDCLLQAECRGVAQHRRPRDLARAARLAVRNDGAQQISRIGVSCKLAADDEPETTITCLFSLISRRWRKFISTRIRFEESNVTSANFLCGECY